MNRTEKEQFVADLRADLLEAKSVILASHVGIEVNDVNRLRSEFRKKGVTYRVVKNTLARLAIRDTEMEGLTAHFIGPIAIAYSKEDAVAPAKVMKDFAKGEDKFEMRAGYLDGDVFDVTGVKRLADLPSKEELQAKFLGMLQAVPSKFVRTLNAAPKKFLMVLSAKAAAES